MTHAVAAQHSGPATSLAFLAGLGAGVAAALLLAPRSGREMRDQLKHKAMATKEHMQEHMATQKENVENKVDEITAAADQAKTEGQEIIQQAKSRSPG